MEKTDKKNNIKNLIISILIFTVIVFTAIIFSELFFGSREYSPSKLKNGKSNHQPKMMYSPKTTELEVYKIDEESSNSDSTFASDSNSGIQFYCKYNGIRHDFILDLPENTKDAPLILMLPGYGNSAESFRNTIQIHKEAVSRGYAVAYINGAKNPDDKTMAIGWRWDSTGKQHAKKNAKNSIHTENDTAFLIDIAYYLSDEYSFNKKRLFAVGFSNGGFMIHTLAMQASDVFCAYASLAGKMSGNIWNIRNKKNDLNFLQVTGEKDDVVPKNSDGTARHAKAPAIEDVMHYWAESSGLKTEATESIGNGSSLIKYSDTHRKKKVWHLIVKDGRHSWPVKNINGIDTNQLLLDFFDSAE